MDHPNCKRLGQYFTSPTVVDFALDLLEWLSADQDAGTRRVIDPACGDGAFLRGALERGLALPANVWGVDRDPELGEVWRDSGLLRDEGPRLHCADGLLWPAEAIDGSFDWVAGNPPYAGEGLKQADTQALRQIASRYQLPALRSGRLISTPEDCRRMPVEVLFVERFIQLCAPGGLVAVVLPVGLFANARWRFVRDWLLGRFTVEGVIGLPRSAFRHAGITAHTCLAVLRKCPPERGHEVFLADADAIGPGDGRNDLPELFAAWQRRRELSDCGRPWAGARRDIDDPDRDQ